MRESSVAGFGAIGELAKTRHYVSGQVLCGQPALLAMTSLTIVKQAILPLHSSSVLTSQISPSTLALKNLPF